MIEPVIDNNKITRIFGLPKNIFFLGITSFFNDLSSEMVFSIFPAFFTSFLHAGAQSLGLVSGIAEGFSNLFKIYSGNLSDKFQKRKPFVVFGYALAVLTRPFYIFANTVSFALGLRILDRVGKGLRDAPRDAIVSFSTPKEEMGRSFGFHRAMDRAGSILGPLVAYFILKSFPMNFNAVFLTAFVVGIFTIISLVFISDVIVNNNFRKFSLLQAFASLSREFKFFTFSIFILSIGSLPIVIMLLKTQSIGLIIADVPLFYMIYNLSYTGFSMLAGKMGDKFGMRKIIFAGYLVLLFSYFLFNLSNSPIILALSFLSLGLFSALTDGSQRSFASQISGDELRGSALGLLEAAVGIGALLAGIGGGYLWQAYGSSIAILISSIVTLFGLILFYFSSMFKK
jgi:MFS family permease